MSLTQCLASFCVLRILARPGDARRALWLHRSCKMVLRRLGFTLRVCGDSPQQGLLVSNHLSYLDILLYGATLPCVFVAKQEVRGWPMLGLLAALGGTVFIDRGSAASAAAAGLRIQQLLAEGVVVLIFPEGTSSDGSSVLKFYPSLFEPAVRAEAPVTPAAIGYAAAPHAIEKDLCYYGDIRFGPHLLQTLRLPALYAAIHFAPSLERCDERKKTAAQAREQVVALRAQTTGSFYGI